MTENPYEAPQTIDTALPLAEEMRVVSVDYAALAEAAKGCSRAGKCYLVATSLTAAELVAGSLLPWEMLQLLWALLIFALVLVSLFFLGWGVVSNTLACRRFKLELPDPKLRMLYASCQRASWLKAVLVVCMLFIPIATYPGGHRSYGYVTFWELLWLYVPAIILLINSVVTVVLHFRGINELGEMLQVKTADKMATLYLFSGVPATLIVVGVFLLLRGVRHSGPPPLLLAVVPLLLVPMLAAYQAAYHRLSQTFLARGKM
jgi:hypothetical protein